MGLCAKISMRKDLWEDFSKTKLVTNAVTDMRYLAKSKFSTSLVNKKNLSLI